MIHTLGFWITAGVVVFAVVSCTIYFFLYRGSSHWPTATGTVEELVRIGSIDNRDCYGIISYSYQVKSEYYSGEWQTGLLPSRQKVVEFVEKFMPKGTKVVVHYHPRCADRSILEVDPQLGKPDLIAELKI